MTRVVHCKKQQFTRYIGRGRGSIFGNPFTHLDTDTLATVKVATRDESILFYRQWLDGDPRWAHVEPERRLAILRMIPALRNQVLGCFCHPLPCHGDVLAEKADSSYRMETL